MEATIAAGHGPVVVATDEEGLSLLVSGRDLHWRWDELTGGGFAKHPGAGREAPDFPDDCHRHGRLPVAADPGHGAREDA